METVHFGCSPANQGVAVDVVDNPITVSNGRCVVPTGPGLGVDVDDAILRHLAV